MADSLVVNAMPWLYVGNPQQIKDVRFRLYFLILREHSLPDFRGALDAELCKLEAPFFRECPHIDVKKPITGEIQLHER